MLRTVSNGFENNKTLDFPEVDSGHKDGDRSDRNGGERDLERTRHSAQTLFAGQGRPALIKLA